MKLIQDIRQFMELRLFEVYDIPEPYTAKHAETRILSRREELKNWIAKLKQDYPVAVEYQQQKQILEKALLKDLELL